VVLVNQRFCDAIDCEPAVVPSVTMIGRVTSVIPGFVTPKTAPRAPTGRIFRITSKGSRSLSGTIELLFAVAR
jgi:hypothetical protein